MLSILSSEWLSRSDSNLPQLGAQRALWPPSVAWISFLSVQGHHTPACFYITHNLAPSLGFAHTHAYTCVQSGFSDKPERKRDARVLPSRHWEENESCQPVTGHP